MVLVAEFPGGESLFGSLDADGDGLLSADEFPGPEELFDRLDADGDGAISEREAHAIPSQGEAGPFADVKADQ